MLETSIENQNAQTVHGKPVVLLVDDKIENLVAFAALLKELDCEILESTSGVDALKILETVSPALIVLDVQMPKMDGFEVARRIRRNQRLAKTPLLFITAIDRDESHIRRAYEVGATDFIHKPVQPEVFSAKVGWFLDYFRTAQALELRMASAIDEAEQERERKAIQNERANLRNLFKQTPEMVVILKGPEHLFEFVNDAHVRTLGFDATGMTVKQAQPEANRLHEILDEVYRTGVTAELSEIPKTIGGKDRFFNLTYAARRDDLGTINGVMVLGSEVTDAIHIREGLRESQERLAFAISSAKMGSWEVLLPSNKVVLSDEAQRIFGFDKEYASSDQAIDAFIHIDDREKARRVLGEAIEKRELYDDIYRVVRPNGEIRWVNTRGRARYDASGAPTMLTGVTIDITDRRRTEEAARESDERLRFALTAAQMGSWEMDLVNHRPLFSEEALVIMGYPRGTASADAPYDRFLHPEDREAAHRTFEKALASRALYRDERRILRPNGQVSWYITRGRATFDKMGRAISMSGIVIDITERKLAEEKVRAAKEEAEHANQLKSAFLANVSHELRTPLGAMLGFADLLRDPYLTIEDRARFIETLTRNGEQLSYIINDVLDLSKVEAGHLKMELVPIRPEEIVNEVLALMDIKAKEKSLALHYQAEPSTPASVVSDPLRVRQILINLLGNAIKFTGAGGIQITSRGLNSDTGRVAIEFEIKDTGIGVPPEQRDRIFEMFVQGDGSMTRRFGGTGLGLALSRRLARALGGEVFLRSSSESGSTFVLTLTDQTDSMSHSTPTQKEERTFTGAEDLKNVSVLIVDDSSDNRALISTFLKRQGAQIETAIDGIEGYEKALAGHHDVILMDIQMPGIDGYTATQRLRAEGFRTPIIAITAHAMNEARAKCLEAGCNDHLPKPIRPKDLIATVVRYSRH